MVRRTVFLTIVVLVAQVSAASAQLFSSKRLESSWCDRPTPRQTVVYIDDMMMVDGRTDWVAKLVTKLNSSLVPGERVSVVRLSPLAGRSNIEWNGCWPDYLPDERKLKEKDWSLKSLLERNPMTVLEEQKGYFFRDMEASMGVIYASGKRTAKAAEIDAKAPPDKQLIRALVSDEGRFSQSRTTIRAIIYSDMAENSDLGSVFRAQPPSMDYGDKLGTNMRRSVFYAFGVGENVRGDPNVQEHTRSFWSAVLTTMSATMAGFGSDLNVSNLRPIAAYTYDVTLVHPKAPTALDGRMALLVDTDGTLVDSWIGFNQLRGSVLTGRLICQTSGSDPECRLEAETNSSVATTAPKEALSLKGKRGAAMEGKLGPSAYPLKAIPSIN